jgi:hypothetical protein
VAATSATSISLSWRNSTSRSLKSTVVRYAKGTQEPSTYRSGTLLATIRKPGHTYVRRGVHAGTRYAFSVFETDGRGHYSKPVKVTATTRSAATMFDGDWSGVATAPAGGLTEPVTFTVANGNVVTFQGWIYGLCSSGALDDVYLTGPAPIKANASVARAESITPTPGYTATSSMTGFFHSQTANGTIGYTFAGCVESTWTWTAAKS